MKKHLRIALVGDFNREIISHQCIPRALEISAQQLQLSVEPVWIHSVDIDNLKNGISNFDGFWCVPGSPYQNRGAVLSVINYARKSLKPYLGTCGGYQHAILEFAKNQLGLSGAELEEENPSAEMLLISSLPCRLLDEARKIKIQKGTKLEEFMNKSEIEEEYRCGFGMNPQYKKIFDGSELKFTAFNEEGIPQAIELSKHPFFIGTAFQPERSSRQEVNHPLISGFIKAMSQASL